jgi:hypothetical protein
MKNLKEYILTENNFFKNLGIGRKALIKDFCEKYTKFGYTINSDETIDATVVNLREYPETEIPEYIQFNKVMRMSVASSKLKTLRGCPQKVGKTFDCSSCSNLVSLEGAPKHVGGNFSCSGCEKLTTISGNQNKVDIHFFCRKCGKKFTKDDIKKHFKVRGQIFV